MQANRSGRAGQEPVLRRALSLPLVTFYGLGNILGAGIYVLMGKVVGEAGLFAPLSFLLAAVLASLTAFSYAELSARFPLSAGEAVYVEEGLGISWLPPVAGMLIILAGIVLAATIMKGFAGYLQVFVPVPAGTAIALMILLLAALWLPIETLAKATSFFLLVVFALVNLSLWRLKRRLTTEKSAVFCVPRWVPAAGFFASTAFVVLQAVLELGG